MRITKFGHAAVRIEHDGASLVIDPGGLTEPAAVEGVDGVLITHEHPDHLDVDNLRRCDAPIFTGAGVAAALTKEAPDVVERVQMVSAGDELSVAGLRVSAHGDLHAVIHDDIPRVGNTAFCVEDEVYHPGDSFTMPPQPVPTLLTPVHAPWLRIAHAVDFSRAAGRRVVIAIHDGFLNDDGLAVTGRVMTGLLEASGLEFRRVQPGNDI